MSHIPAQNSVELVYLGLSPRLRGKGIATPLLHWAAGHARRTRAGELTCAVDQANEPAKRLYARFGFESFALRIAYVAPIGASAGAAANASIQRPEAQKA